MPVGHPRRPLRDRRRALYRKVSACPRYIDKSTGIKLVRMEAWWIWSGVHIVHREDLDRFGYKAIGKTLMEWVRDIAGRQGHSIP
jgi:hypothetical protein